MHHKAKSKVTTKCCYSCGEEGHISSDSPKKRERFPTFVVKYEEHELQELLALERTKKKKNKSQENKQETMIPKKKKDISQVMCHKCKELGHYASHCPEKKEDKTRKPMRDINLVTCFKCGNKGHYANNCPEKLHQDPK